MREREFTERPGWAGFAPELLNLIELLLILHRNLVIALRKERLYLLLLLLHSLWMSVIELGKASTKSKSRKIRSSYSIACPFPSLLNRHLFPWFMNLTFSLQSSTEKIRSWKKWDKTKTPDPPLPVSQLRSFTSFIHYWTHLLSLFDFTVSSLIWPHSLLSFTLLLDCKQRLNYFFSFSLCF